MHIEHKQGNVLKEFKEKEKFVNLIKDFDVSKSTMMLRRVIVKLVNKYPKLIYIVRYCHLFFKELL